MLDHSILEVNVYLHRRNQLVKYNYKNKINLLILREKPQTILFL